VLQAREQAQGAPVVERRPRDLECGTRIALAPYEQEDQRGVEAHRIAQGATLASGEQRDQALGVLARVAAGEVLGLQRATPSDPGSSVSDPCPS
jgi:hypothetical protein